MPEPCPVAGCPKTWRSVDGLVSHLYRNHNKSELIKVILALKGIELEGEALVTKATT